MDPIKQSENSRLEVGTGEFFELLEWFFLWSGYWNRSMAEKNRKVSPDFRSHGCTTRGMIHCMGENPIEMEVSKCRWLGFPMFP